jgi:hypothetical protein
MIPMPLSSRDDLGHSRTRPKSSIVFRTVAVLFLLILILACRVHSGAGGSYEVVFVWNGYLRSAEVIREGSTHTITANVRDDIIREAEPIIREQLKRANLVEAEGKLKLVLSGLPPYVVSSSGIQILRPSISQLLGAVEREDVKEINALVSRNRNVNQKELPSERTALFMAAAGGRLKSLRALLALGADPNLPDFEGDTPIQAAVVADSPKSVQLLIDAHAQCDYANGVGVTPLMKAAELGRTEILKMLLRSGANRNLKANNGQTPLMFAREAGHSRAAEILQQP